MTDKIYLPKYLSSGQSARLIPVVADTSRENRAASIILSALTAIPSYRKVMLEGIGLKVGVRAQVQCFTEITFKDNKEINKYRPDGLIILDSGGGRRWTCLVEAKIKKEQIDPIQIEKYLALAKHQNIDAILTISNEFVAIPTHSPLNISKSTAKSIDIFHWSWMHAVTEAMLLLNADNFNCPEQVFLLSEIIRYFSHPSTGVTTFDRMNSEWKEVVTKIQSGGVLNKSDISIENSIAAWHQESRDICLLLSRKLKRPVQMKLKRAHANDSIERVKNDCETLSKDYKLECIFDIPDAAAPMSVVADLIRRSVTVSMMLVAPQNKQKTSSKINWLLRQITDAKDDELYIKVFWPSRSAPTQEQLSKIRNNNKIIDHDNKKITPTSFEIMLIHDLAHKFTGSKTFIEHLEQTVIKFYEQVGQYLQPYIPPPPTIEEEQKVQTQNIKRLNTDKLDHAMAPLKSEDMPMSTENVTPSPNPNKNNGENNQ